MENIIGYGFDVNDVTGKAFVGFIRKFAKEDYDSMLSDLLKTEAGLSAELPAEEEIEMYAREWVLDHNDSEAQFIASVINEKEKSKILSYADNYVFYESVVFPGEREDRKAFSTREEFEQMLRKYLPDVACKMIWEGSSWFDPCYWTE